MQKGVAGRAVKQAILVLAALIASLALPGATARTETILYSFQNGTGDGANPEYGQLVADSAGNLYGTTFHGETGDGGGGNECPLGCGTVFKLSRQAGGIWIETILHNFQGYPTDGRNPEGTLTFDAAGNLYGTTTGGGGAGFGTAFALSPQTGGNWSEKILYNFTGTDGDVPAAGVVFDQAGNLYGTTSEGGTDYNGNVFELSPQAGGAWNETDLHDFQYNGADGIAPFSGVAIDKGGNLYGTTYEGGNGGYGVVYELSPLAGGGWSETILHSFQGDSDGGYPYAGVILDKVGNLYGMTTAAASGYTGTIFELSSSQAGIWNQTILYAFQGSPDGAFPVGGLVFDGSGHLFGSTAQGGNRKCSDVNFTGCGTVFELGKTPKNGWEEKLIHSFAPNDDGFNPQSGLIFGKDHALYGTTTYGGSGGVGTVYRVVR